MNDYIEVLSRAQKGTSIGGSNEATQEFTVVADPSGHLEAVKGTRRFNGVSMEDQSSPSYTHACYIPFDPDVYELDVNSFFVRITRDKPRYFKMKLITNYDESDTYLQLQLAETGFTDLEASSV
jgi:hypothetical protein